MNIEIVTPDKKVFAGEASVVTLPGTDGSFQLLNGHAAIVSTLAKGDLIVEQNNTKQTFVVDGGVVEVLNNKVLVLAESVVG